MSKRTSLEEAPLSAISITNMLVNEKESPLFKEYNAALAHLAALEDAKELQFFLETMDKIIERKLEEEAATYSAYYENKKREEINYLIDIQNKKEQNRVESVVIHVLVDTHVIYLALTALAHSLTQWHQAQQRVIAAITTQNTIAANWQTAQQTFATNAINNLNALGVNPELVAEVQNQLQIGQPGQLPLQTIQRLRLDHIQRAYNDEVQRKIESQQTANAKLPEEHRLSNEQIHILAAQQAADSVNLIGHQGYRFELVIRHAIKNDKELVEKIYEEYAHLPKYKALNKRVKEICDAHGFLEQLRSATRKHIAEQLKQEYAQRECDAYKSSAEDRLDATIQLAKRPDFKSYLEKVKSMNMGELREELSDRLSFKR